MVAKRLGRSELILVVEEDGIVRDPTAARGLGLGLLMGIIDRRSLSFLSETRLNTREDLRAGVMNFDLDSATSGLRIFCGAETNAADGLVARAYIRQNLSVEGDQNLCFTAGVESVSPADGITKYWFEVASVFKIEVGSDGQMMFTWRGGETTNISRLGERSRAAVLDKIMQAGVPGDVLTLAQDIRWVGSVMSGFAQHRLGNPYRSWPEKKIWQKLISLDLSGWHFCLPSSKL